MDHIGPITDQQGPSMDQYGPKNDQYGPYLDHKKWKRTKKQANTILCARATMKQEMLTIYSLGNH